MYIRIYMALYAKSDYAITESIFFLREGLLQCTCSFNVLQVLELWLTYVQPWRYTDPLKPSSENKDSLEALPRKWCGIIVLHMLYESRGARQVHNK